MNRYNRRIQFTGKSTYIVSLPKKWVLYNKLNPGDLVLIEDHLTHLLIKPFKGQETDARRRASIHINLETSAETTTRLVIASYLMGYDEVIVRSDDHPIQPSIRNTIRRVVLEKLPGTEIIYEDQHRVEIRILLGVHGITIDETFKRLGKVVESILEDSCTALSTGRFDLVDEIAKEDDSVDRVYFYLVRLLNKIALGELEYEKGGLQDLLMYRSASKLLERIGDHAVNISLNMADLSRRSGVLVRTGDLCNYTLGIYREALNAFNTSDPWSIVDISARVESLKREEDKLFNESISELTPPELASLRVILESIRRIAEYSRDLAELALNRGLKKIIEESNDSAKSHDNS